MPSLHPLGIWTLLAVLGLSACLETAEPPDDSFSLSAMPATLALAPGEAGGVYLTVERAEAFSGPVELEITGLTRAIGVETTLNPSPLYGERAAVAFEVASDAPPQELELSLSARSRTREEHVALTLRVAPREPAGAAEVGGQVVTANVAIRIEQELFGLPRTQAPSVQETGARYVPGELLIQYRVQPPGDPAADELLTASALESYRLTAQAVLEDFALQPLRAGDAGRPDLVRLPEASDPLALAERLSRDPRVLYAEPNYILSTASSPESLLDLPSALPDDPLLGEQWAAAAAGLPVAWAQERGVGESVVVAVIDSGFDLAHEDLAGRFLPGYDFCSKPSGPCSDPGTPTDDDPSFGSSYNAHGSHVAGTLGAIGGNGLGVTGAAFGPSIQLLPVKIFNGSGGGATTSSFIDGIRWAAGLNVTTTDGKRVTNPNPARVINLSLGVDRPSAAMQGAINEARRRGAVVVAATGNAGADRVWSPAAAEGVLGVGSHNQSFLRSCFSNYGLAGPNGPGGVDIVAGGGETCGARQSVLSTVPENDYGYLVGTSMATPLVSGVIALLLSRHPELSVDEVEARLLDTAYFDARFMREEEYGAGVLRADRALGLPGPGDPVIVRDALSERSSVAVLDLYGGSTPYLLSGLAAGELTLRAGAEGPGTLAGERRLVVTDGVTEADIALEYRP